MADANTTIPLVLSINAGPDARPAEADQLARQLCTELQRGPVQSADLVEGDVPVPGKKGVVVAIGSLAVTILPQLLPKLVDFLQAWLLRDTRDVIEVEASVGDRTVKIKANSKMSADEIRKLVEAAGLKN